jgi:hypothetical protein
MLLVFWPLITGAAPSRGVGSGEAVGWEPGVGKGRDLAEAQSLVTTAVATTSTPTPQSMVTVATTSPATASTSTHNYVAGFTSTPPVNPANT